MKQSDFEALGEQAQMEVLYRRGVYIGKRWQQGRPSVLYQIEGFYVEVTYVRYRLEVGRITTFCSTEGLDPYLEGMVLELFA